MFSLNHLMWSTVLAWRLWKVLIIINSCNNSIFFLFSSLFFSAALFCWFENFETPRHMMGRCGCKSESLRHQTAADHSVSRCVPRRQTHIVSHVEAPVDELFTCLHVSNDRRLPGAKMLCAFEHACNNAMLINVADWEQAIFPRTPSLYLMFSHLQFPACFSALKHACGIKRFPPHQMLGRAWCCRMVGSILYCICEFKRMVMGWVGERGRGRLRRKEKSIEEGGD